MRERFSRKGFENFDQSDPSILQELFGLCKPPYTLVQDKPNKSLALVALINRLGVSVDAILSSTNDLTSDPNKVRAKLRQLKGWEMPALLEATGLTEEMKGTLRAVIEKAHIRTQTSSTAPETQQLERTTPEIAATAKFRNDQNAINRAVSKLLLSLISPSELSLELSKQYGITPSTLFLKEVFGSELEFIRASTDHPNFSDEDYRALRKRRRERTSLRQQHVSRVRSKLQLERRPKGTLNLTPDDITRVSESISGMTKSFSGGLSRQSLFKNNCNIQLAQDTYAHELSCTVHIAESFNKSATLWQYFREQMQRGAQIRQRDASSILIGTCFAALPPLAHINVVLRIDQGTSGMSMTLSPSGAFFSTNDAT